jgi:hypothetical protein
MAGVGEAAASAKQNFCLHKATLKRLAELISSQERERERSLISVLGREKFTFVCFDMAA